MKKNCVLVYLLCFFLMAHGQNVRVISGKVTDQVGAPLAGVSVIIENSRVGGATDVNGEFRLEIPKVAKQLVFSFVGMQTQRVRIHDNMHVVLYPEVEELEESLVVAYGSVQKKSFAGAAVSVGEEKLKNRPLTVVTNGLEGLIPGVQIAEPNGQPGAEMHLRIRGFGSINADNEPVYVVDGAMFQGALCDINPNDIESLTILKDAAATALYGSSAGNGVVLITTKSARSGKPSLSFSMKQGFSERGIPEYDRVNVWDYYPLEWEMFRNSNLSQGKTVEQANAEASAKIFDKLNYNPFKGVGNDQIVTSDGMLNPLATQLIYGDDLDWEGDVTRKGYRSEYNLSYQMKGEKADLYASLSYLKENGSVVASDLERFSGMLKGNVQPLRWLKTGLSLNFVRTNCQMANTQDNASDAANPFYFTRYIGPIYPIHVWDVNGVRSDEYDYKDAVRGVGSTQFGNRNIVAETLSDKNSFERNGVNGRGYIEVTLLEGLRVTANLTMDSYDYLRKQYENNFTASSPGRLYQSSIRTTTLTANQLIQYERVFGHHAVSALAGHESYSYEYEYLYGNKLNQFLNGVYDMYNFQTLGSLNSYTNLYRKEGYFAQAVYGYADKYNVSVSWRRDGTSRFRAANRWGNFWSVGLAWQLKQENFIKNLSFIDHLKLRASYGAIGNDNVLRTTSSPNTYANDYYPSQTLYGIGVNNASEPGIAFKGFGNPALKWETQMVADVALEFGLLEWLNGSIEYFQKDSRDLLFKVPQVLSSGASEIWENVGKVSNKGVELALDFRVIHTRDWSWHIGGNATFFRNKIVKMPASQSEIVVGTQKLEAGKSLYSFWLKEYRGVNPETGDVQYAFDGSVGKWNEKTCFVNTEGDSLTYNSALACSHYAGSSLPKVYGGVNTGLSYRNFDCSVVLAYSVGGKVYNTGYQVLMYNGKYGQALHKDIRNRWQKPGDITDVPRLDDDETNLRTGLKTATQTNAVSDHWLCDASYLNVKSVTLRYRFPAGLLNKAGIREASVFLNGENLYLWSAMRGLDPRQLYKGVISVSNPPSRTYTLGLSFTL